MAAALQGSQWIGQSVLVWCDNEVMVIILNQGTSKDLEAMHLIRCLAFIMAKQEFYLFASHIKGQFNTQADALSHNNVSSFKFLHPQAHPVPTNIPAALLGLLIIRKPGWLSKIWIQLQNSIFPWHSCINTEGLCFCQVSILSIMQYKQSQCMYSIKAAFMSIFVSLVLEGLSHTTVKVYLSGIRHLHLIGELLTKPKHKCYGTLGTSAEGH